MNDNGVTVSKFVWVATAVAFLLIFGSIWFASSLSDNAPTIAASKPDIPASPGPGGEGTVYGERVAPEPPVAVVRTAPLNAAAPPSVGNAEPPAPVLVQPLPKPKRAKKTNPRDMFPVGDITRDMPRVSHPFRQVAELFPCFSYEGSVWTSTGRYVRTWEADLTPTGFSLATGQALYALSNTAAPDAVLFVQSTRDPSKFAVYRRLKP